MEEMIDKRKLEEGSKDVLCVAVLEGVGGYSDKGLDDFVD